MGKHEPRVRRRRRLCRVPALACATALLQVGLSASAPGCVLSHRETRIDVLGEERLAVGAGHADMRTDYGALSRGEVALRFEGETPCRVRVVETYEKVTNIERRHTRSSWYVYGGIAGAGVVTAATGLGLGLDATSRNNNVANGLLSYSIYVLAGTAAVFAANMIRTGRFERKEGPFRRGRIEPLEDCGASGLAGSDVAVSLPSGATTVVRTDETGLASFSPFELVDAFAAAHVDTVFRVTLSRVDVGAHSFDFGLTAAVLRAAAERFISERRLRAVPPLPPETAPTGPTAASEPTLHASVAASRDEDIGRVTVSLKVRNEGPHAAAAVRGTVVAGPEALLGHWLYVGDLASDADGVGEISLPIEGVPPGSAITVAILTAADGVISVAGTL